MEYGRIRGNEMESKVGLEIYGRRVYRYTYNLINSNMYIILGMETAMMIDCIQNQEALDLLKIHNIKRLYVILTHEHYDHIQGVNFYRNYFECLVMGSEDALKAIGDPKKNLAAYLESIVLFKNLPVGWRDTYNIPADYRCIGDVVLQDNQVYEWETMRFRIVYTPGHSRGSICIDIDGRYVFTGDSLIPGETVILRLPGGNKKDYRLITRPYLEHIDNNSVIFPGHGECTTRGLLQIG